MGYLKKTLHISALEKVKYRLLKAENKVITCNERNRIDGMIKRVNVRRNIFHFHFNVIPHCGGFYGDLLR